MEKKKPTIIGKIERWLTSRPTLTGLLNLPNHSKSEKVTFIPSIFFPSHLTCQFCLGHCWFKSRINFHSPPLYLAKSPLIDLSSTSFLPYFAFLRSFFFSFPHDPLHPIISSFVYCSSFKVFLTLWHTKNLKEIKIQPML